jgi:hypothetical protein
LKKAGVNACATTSDDKRRQATTSDDGDGDGDGDERRRPTTNDVTA